MVRAPAQNARAKPAEFAARSDRIRLALDLPIAVGRGEVAPLAAAEIEAAILAGSAMWNFVGPLMLFEIAGRVEHAPGFHQRHAYAQVGENLRDGAPSRSRADHRDVVLRTLCSPLPHSSRIARTEATQLRTNIGPIGLRIDAIETFYLCFGEVPKAFLPLSGKIIETTQQGERGKL